LPAAPFSPQVNSLLLLSATLVLSSSSSTSCFFAVDQQTKVHEDLKIKLLEGAKQRKELYNKVLELKGELPLYPNI